MTLAVAEAGFIFELGDVPFDDPVDFGLDEGHVVGLAQLVPVIDRDRGNVGQAVADHFGPTVIDDIGTRREISFPRSDLCAFDHIGEVPFGTARRRHISAQADPSTVGRRFFQ
jgi:hypothetical protein